MADTAQTSHAGTRQNGSARNPNVAARSFAPKPPPLHEIHSRPLPIRTFPLPSFYPNNPLSWAQVAYVWLSQTLAGPPTEPSVIHQAVWCAETKSVQVVDPASIRALWEQGFFGKGIYSRSEPNWLRREQKRRNDAAAGHVAELFTQQRRDVRRQMKWDRAREEQKAIRRTRLKEAFVAPVGPQELLALPNSEQDWLTLANMDALNTEPPADYLPGSLLPSNGRSGGLLPGTATLVNATGASASSASSGSESVDNPVTSTRETTPSPPGDAGSVNPTKRRKSVRFSSHVETTSFLKSDPPSPKSAILMGASNLSLEQFMESESISAIIDTSLAANSLAAEQPTSAGKESTELVDRESLQLTPEEAFFLSYGMGALSMTTPSTGIEGNIMSVHDLLDLFRRNSYSPPRLTSELQPDDPFLIHYVVYHHFRSLGWVPRAGVKFGVDWLLYHRGPAFSHAEFAAAVIPTYTDPWWKGKRQDRSWQWLYTVMRVQALALKTVMLVYVDVPPPADDLGVSETLKRYKIREFKVRRWVSNRNR